MMRRHHAEIAAPLSWREALLLTGVAFVIIGGLGYIVLKLVGLL